MNFAIFLYIYVISGRHSNATVGKLAKNIPNVEFDHITEMEMFMTF